MCCKLNGYAVCMAGLCVIFSSVVISLVYKYTPMVAGMNVLPCQGYGSTP